MSIFFCAIFAAAASVLNLAPKGGDPTMSPPQRLFLGKDAAELPCMFFGGEGVTGVTVAVWAKWDKCWTNMFDYIPTMLSSVAYETARSTTEGGPSLPNLIDDTYLTNSLPLDGSGNWSAMCLPGTATNAPPTVPDWKYGCYVVNYKSDTPFTLTVGGAERYCAATNNCIFNVIAETADRSVSISAEDPSAEINFGIAQNPLCQFVSAYSDNMDDYGFLPSNDNYGGIATNEWRMFVVRSRIDGGTNIVVQMDAWRPSFKCEKVVSDTQAMWHPRQYFAKDSRARFLCFYICGGLESQGQKQVIRYYAPKGKEYWMTDAEIELWRDKDIAEIERRRM